MAIMDKRWIWEPPLWGRRRIIAERPNRLTRSVSISNIFVDVLYSSVAPSTITLDTGPGDDLEGPYARPMQTKIGGMGQIGAL